MLCFAILGKVKKNWICIQINESNLSYFNTYGYPFQQFY